MLMVQWFIIILFRLPCCVDLLLMEFFFAVQVLIFIHQLQLQLKRLIFFI